MKKIFFISSVIVILFGGFHLTYASTLYDGNISNSPTGQIDGSHAGLGYLIDIRSQDSTTNDYTRYNGMTGTVDIYFVVPTTTIYSYLHSYILAGGGNAYEVLLTDQARNLCYYSYGTTSNLNDIYVDGYGDTVITLHDNGTCGGTQLTDLTQGYDVGVYTTGGASFTASSGFNYPVTGTSTPIFCLADYVCDPTGTHGGGGTASTYLRFPDNNAVIPNFSDWSVGVNLSSTADVLQKVGVVYGTNSSTFDYNDSINNYSSFSTTTLQFSVYKQHLISVDTSTVIYARAYIGDNYTDILGPEISFTIDPSIQVNVLNSLPIDASTTVTTSTLNEAGPFYDTIPVSSVPPAEYSGTSTIGLPCQAPGDPALDFGGDLTYAGCNIVNFLFVPSTLVTTPIQSQVTLIQNDFPFNMVYGTINTIEQGADAAVNSSSTDLILPIWGMNIPVLTSTTLSGFVGNENHDLIFRVEDGVAWAGVGFTILKIIF